MRGLIRCVIAGLLNVQSLCSIECGYRIESTASEHVRDHSMR